MIPNPRRRWQRMGLWLAILLGFAAVVAVVLLAGFGYIVLAWVVTASALLVPLVILVVRLREDVLGRIEDLVDEVRDQAGMFDHPDAPGRTVPVAARLGGLVVALATAYYLPRAFVEFAGARGTTFFVVLVCSQFVAQALAFRLTRPTPGDLKALRLFAEAARSRDEPRWPVTPEDVIEYHARLTYGGRFRPQDLRQGIVDLGLTWRGSVTEDGDDGRARALWRGPADMLYWLAHGYRAGFRRSLAVRTKDTRQIVDEAYRRGPEKVRPQVLGGLFGTSAALRANKELARQAGFVVDDAWSRLKLVLPGDLRRRHLLAESAVTWSRLVFAVAVGWGVFGFVVWSWFTLVPLVLAGWALAVGRRRVVRAYEMRVATADVYRFELAKRKRLALPASQAKAARLGAALTGDESDWPLVREENNTVINFAGDVNSGTADTSRLEKQLAHTQEALSREVRQASDRLRTSVAEALSGPTMVNFTGYLAVEHLDDDAFVNGSTIVAEPESQIGVVVSVLADPRARNSAPERGTRTDQFMVLQPVDIEGGRTASEVEFELVVDSATLRPVPRRHTVLVAPDGGQAQVQVMLRVPEQDGRHEAWLQLFQAGQLVQAIVVVVEAAHA